MVEHIKHSQLDLSIKLSVSVGNNMYGASLNETKAFFKMILSLFIKPATKHKLYDEIDECDVL